MASSEFAPEQLSLSLNVQVLLRLPLSSHTQMDQLRAAMAARKAEVAKVVSSSAAANNPSPASADGDSAATSARPPQKPSYVRRADLEAARLKRLREEEEAERAAKVRERKRKR